MDLGIAKLHRDGNLITDLRQDLLQARTEYNKLMFEWSRTGSLTAKVEADRTAMDIARLRVQLDEALNRYGF